MVLIKIGAMLFLGFLTLLVLAFAISMSIICFNDRKDKDISREIKAIGVIVNILVYFAAIGCALSCYAVHLYLEV